MELLRFVNSKDIREHLRKTGYQFSALEAAWLIEQCRDSTLAERHQAWEELIAEYPDCPIPERMNTVPQDSLHQFLRDYMDMENRFLKQFRNPEGAVYQLIYHFYSSEPVYENRAFSRFDPEKMIFLLDEDENYQFVQCVRLPVDDPAADPAGQRFSVDLNADGGILRINPVLPVSEHDTGLLLDVFQGLWFDFPTPFRKGDILWDPRKPDGFCGGPFVNQAVNLQGIADEKRIECLRKDGDSSDMTVHGLFVDAQGGIYGEVMHCYMNCEYYPKELTGILRTLIPFSAYEKGDIDAELLAHAYHQIMLEVEKENNEPYCYTEGTRKIAGLF